MNLAWWLERAAWEHGDKVAVIDGQDETQVTYAELAGLVNRIGNVLKEGFGVKEDDVVVTLLPDDHWHMAVLYGVQKIGAVFSGLNRTQLLEKFKHDVSKSQARTLITNSQFFDTARKLHRETCVENVLVRGDTDGEFPDLEHLAGSAPDELRVTPRKSDEIAAVNFTAGTSGPSKGVVFTHGKLGLSALSSVFFDGLRSSDTNLGFIGVFHSGGIHDSIKWVMAGGTIIWNGGWDADRAVYLSKKYRPTWMYFWVPTMIRDLMRHPEWESLDLAGVKANLAGERVPAEIHRILVEEKGMRIINLYGLTETMPVAVLKPSLYYGDDRVVPFGSSGRPNKELSEVKLKDPITGEEVTGLNEEGEICMRGEVVTPGYYNDPERTAQALDEEGYLHTRDLAYRDEQGWYWIGGRADDIINTGAEKLSLYEVEEVVLGHPAVEDAACIGVEHERFGQVPTAFIVPSETMTEEQVRDLLDAHCLENLERWKRPRLYVLMEEIPRTMAKKTKSIADLKEIVRSVVLSEDDGVTTMSDVGSREPGKLV